MLAGHAAAYQPKHQIYIPSNNPSCSLGSSAGRTSLWCTVSCGRWVTCLVFAFVRPSPAQPDLVLPEVGCDVGNHPLHADALPGAVLPCHFAGQLWLQNQPQLLGQVAGQACCQCLTPSPDLRNTHESDLRRSRTACKCLQGDSAAMQCHV